MKKISDESTTRPLNTSAINFPTKIPTDIPDAFPKFINNSLIIATVLSEEIYENLQYECQLLDLKKLNVKEVLSQSLPHFLLVEAQDFNTNKLESIKRKFNNKKRKSIIKQFNSKGIPTVLWVTTPLNSFKHYHYILPLFTLVLSTDYSNIAALKKLVNHENVCYLPYGVQTRLYNPISTEEKSVFAGYLSSISLHEENFNPNQSEFLFAAAEPYALDVIKPTENFKDLIITLKKYYVVLYESFQKPDIGNIDPILYQLLACGINVITPYDEDLKQTFGEHLLFVKSPDETQDLLYKLYKDRDLRDRLSLLGQRFIFDSNTYTHRIETMLDKLNYQQLKQSKPGISIICCTHMTSFMDNIFENFHRQTYDKKELIIILNDPNMDKSIWEEKAKCLSNVRIIQPATQKSVGYCVNLAVKYAYYDYIANFDHDDYYGTEYIRDNLNVFKYTDAGLIGKKTHYVYFEDTKTLSLMLPNYDNKYVVNIDGSSIVFKKEIFNKVHFIDNLFADVQFSLDCWNNNIKVYSCDLFNHVYVRRTSKEQHAFKACDDEFKKLTYTIIEPTDDFKPYVNV